MGEQLTIDKIPTNCNQLLWVNFNGVNTRGGSGKFMIFEDNKWKTIIEDIRCNGGLEGFVQENLKVEGDYKTPLGIYSFGTAFGYHEFTDRKFNYPYIKLTNAHFGIDDIHSTYYNQIVEVNEVKRDWVSAESMLREDHQYEYGVEIRYNPNNIPKKGSCIYFHIWKTPDSLSEGCITSDISSVTNIINYLDPNLNPHILITAENVSDN